MKNKYKCKNIGCNESFKHTMQLVRHKCDKPPPPKKYQKEDGMFRCSSCFKVFAHQPNIVMHVKKCTGAKKKGELLHCPKCPSTFSFPSRLQQHMLTHNKVEMRCPKCSRVYKRKDHFDNHVASCDGSTPEKVSNTETSYTCSSCGHVYLKRAFFDRHVLTCDTADMIPSFAIPYKEPYIEQDSEVSMCEKEQDLEDRLKETEYDFEVSILEKEQNFEERILKETEYDFEVSILEKEQNFEDSMLEKERSLENCMSERKQNLEQSMSEREVNFEESEEEKEQKETQEQERENEKPTKETTDQPFESFNVFSFDTSFQPNSTILQDITTDWENLSDDENLSPSLAKKKDRSKYYKEQKERKRKQKRLESLIHSFSSPVRNKVLKSQKLSPQPKDLNSIFGNQSEESQECKAAKAIVNFLRKMNRGRLYSSFYQHFNEIFGDLQEDREFMLWIMSQLNIRLPRFVDRMEQWKSRHFADSRGRARISPEVRKKVIGLWIENSVTSTNGSNMRNMINIKKRKAEEIYTDITVLNHDDVKIDERQNKRNQIVLSSNRRIATSTVREIQKKLSKLNVSLSIGKIITLKPFFITFPTEKEMSLCLCKLCLNTRLLFNVIMDQEKKEGGDGTKSITEFFWSSARCEKEENGYYKWKCVAQKCKECKNLKPLQLKCKDSVCIRKVSQFETTKKPYKKTDKEGKEITKISKKTERVEHDLEIRAVYEMLAELKKKYLMHRYQVMNDQYHWPRVLATTDLGPIFHADFSENLAQMYKNEPQSSHFNKPQYSLHCTVKHVGEKSQMYLYHFSDDKKHDYAFTFAVIQHLLSSEETEEQSSPFRIKSDNCSTQYKCKYVFRSWRNLAREQRRVIIVYYGVSGHGKGLVDSMSAFGCKTPLRRAVVTDDFVYNCADDIKNFLEKKFSDDDQKKYFTISTETTKQLRRDESCYKIKNCQQQHMISFFPTGEIQCKINICSCNQCISGKFVSCPYEKGISVSGSYDSDSDDTDDSDIEYEKEDEADEMEEDYQIRGDEVLSIIMEGNVIALYSTVGADEPFYLCLVKGFGTASEVLSDKNNHCVPPGEPYISCQYFQRVNLKLGKKEVKYKLLPDIVYVHPASVVSPLVNLSHDFQLTIEDYIWLADAVRI